MNLLNKKITILRYKLSSGYYNENEEWVDGISLSPVTVKGNIQPYQQGFVKEEFPTGVSVKDVIVLYSKDPIIVQDDLLKTASDEMDYLGARYQCFSSDPWVQGMKIDHYHAIFIRKDKL